MQVSSDGDGCPTLYALVSYIPDELGEFLNRLRAELVPQCSLLSHVTVLPPRELHAPLPDLHAELQELTRPMPPVEITLGDVKKFDGTDVVYLDVVGGRTDLLGMHLRLNRGALSSREPFEFCPHITLAQLIPPGLVQSTFEAAKRRWSEWTRNRRFPVDSLTFVRNVSGLGWSTLDEYPLRVASLPRRG
jgi:2'-5' RNA ligase